jgi:hypothetical protein
MQAAKENGEMRISPFDPENPVECWSAGVLGLSITPSLHHSIPLLHHPALRRYTGRGLAQEKRGRRKKVVANGGASVFYFPHAKHKRATFAALRTLARPSPPAILDCDHPKPNLCPHPLLT